MVTKSSYGKIAHVAWIFVGYQTAAIDATEILWRACRSSCPWFCGLSDRGLSESAYGGFGGRDPIRSRSTAGHACRGCHRRVRLAHVADGCYIFNTIICALGGADPLDRHGYVFRPCRKAE